MKIAGKNRAVQIRASALFVLSGIVLTFLILPPMPALAATVTYYLENNATIQSVGADGNTDYNVSGTTITVIPYDNLLDLGPMGTAANIRYAVGAGTTYQIFRFYLPFNYSSNVRISANANYKITWRTGVSTTDIVNVSLIVYNPATGNKIYLGSAQNTTTGGATYAPYTNTMNNPQYIVPAGSRLIMRINTTPTAAGTSRLQFNDAVSSYINVTETAITYNLSGYITDKSSGLPISGAAVQTNTSVTGTTDASGYYILAGLSNGTYIVSASLYGYDTNSTTKTVSGADVANANISLSPATAYLLSGYVKDQSSGAAISGARVTTNTSHTATTDASGYYSFTVYNWTHLIMASKTGYTANSIIRPVNGAAVGNANISLLSVQPKILIATNRYVILDDPRNGTTGAGFSNPGPGYDWTTWDYWFGKNTRINATALFIDTNGFPIPGSIISFTITNPGGSQVTTVNSTTDSNGLAKFSYDLNLVNYYGNWQIKAANGSLNGSATFIYNWWGCGIGSGCSNNAGGHPNNPGAATTVTANSPYLNGKDEVTNRDPAHQNGGSTSCTRCHQSYDGSPGGNTLTVNHNNNPSDVHRNLTCANANCHGDYTTHGSTPNGQLIYSCYNSGCHGNWSSWDRKDLSNKSTLNSSNVATALSLYSVNTSSFNSTFHTPNSTVPCIICHGPMHNITKPDETWRWIRNNDTEDAHCTNCHQSYNEHNGSVNCTLCHSDDVHYIQVFARNATGAYYKNVTGTSNPPSNCTLCHQNGTKFFNSIQNLTDAGSYSGRDPPQVAVPVSTYVPVEHSNDTAAGTKWNSSPGYWNNSIQFTWCLYCHGNTTHSDTALGRPSQFDGTNVVNSSLSLSASWCTSCHWQGYTNGSNAYGDAISTFISGSLPVPPEITGNATYSNTSSPSFFNHTNLSIKSDISCYGCHKNGTSASITGFLHNLTDVSTRVSGPDCIGCHDYANTDSDALHRINNSDMNRGMHANLNRNATNSSGVRADNKKCWGCHTSNGSEPRPYYGNYYNMGDRFANPYECYDCHNSTGKPYANVSGAFNVSEHFKSGAQIRAASGASDNSSSCVVCHNLSEMKVSYNESDIYYSGLSIASHYGRNRTDLRTWDSGKAANCSYCHQNVSTAFSVAMLDWTYNSSIKNHTQRPANPDCFNSSCHNTGWLHNSSLTRPALNVTNTSSYCSICHGVREKHNGTQDCSRCHFNTSTNDTIHPIKYILDNGSYNTSNISAATCITCHQTGIAVFPDAPKILSPLNHSDNTTNGSIWNSTAYWTSALTACTYCHNDTKHNATALGKPAYWKGNNIVNSSINAGTWCSSCHWRGYSSGGKNYTDMTSTFASANLSVPPEITNGTYARNIYNRSGYYNHSLTNYDDGTCKLCHGTDLPSGVTITSLMHNITVNTCTDCHYSFEAMNNTTRPDRYVDPSMYATSLHSTLNCTQCHTKGHRNIGARKACEDCHAVQQNPITDRDRHNITAAPGAGVVNNTDCTSCHSSTLYNTSIATYGYWKPKDCDYCHTYPDKYYE